MKIAVTIAGEHAKSSAFVVWQGFERSIRKAKEYGYDGVELALKTPDELDRAQLRRWLQETSMEVSCVTTGQVFADLGLYFTHPDPDIRKKTVEVFTSMIDFASEFGGIVNAGRARGFVAPGQTREEVEELFVETMRTLCDRAAEKGVKLLHDSCTNQQFFVLPDEWHEVLSKDFAMTHMGKPDKTHTAVRICTSWATKAENVETLIEAVKKL